MKTSKTNAISKPKKSSVDEEAKMSRKPAASKPVPTVEEIRNKAYEIYNQRINRGIYGTESDDWNAAESLLKGS
jgi:hypothetical protein